MRQRCFSSLEQCPGTQYAHAAHKGTTDAGRNDVQERAVTEEEIDGTVTARSAMLLIGEPRAN
jgi:hypothetical protein